MDGSEKAPRNTLEITILMFWIQPSSGLQISNLKNGKDSRSNQHQTGLNPMENDHIYIFLLPFRDNKIKSLVFNNPHLFYSLL